MGSSSAQHILVVDDEEAITYVFERYLSIAGFRVSTANRGEDALRVFGAEPADLVITDFRMPGMNGVELIERLRTLAPGLPALLVSANPVDVDTMPPGVHFLSKPVSMPELPGVVASLIANAGPKQGAPFSAP
jgi:two-component system chemotaxis response regulator CheY